MDEAIDMAMIDKENYTLNILDDITINVDFKHYHRYKKYDR